MAHPNRRAASRIAAVLSMITLFGAASGVAGAAVWASPGFPLQPQCGPDPVTLIDPCEILPPPAGGGQAAGPAVEIPWDLVDSVLFG
ncbi:MAG: hypothetical protein K0U71_14310 [Actinomycetia bacterium]|nr:hypothetical protein [Actinomycetes bacterium]